ncbi:hypothetical protein [Rhodoplanes roseus]|uniref:Uncharacterized protein n=1 Tax=Rhodoplanes roseus TaxID=29409 RepID=A0A327L2V5_9BRAD|nr:hypothetical protein [Rhodoplanes roseus]RAI45269.1 hypothetical protein CH341_04975 [Rhodoplanes roseus]
MAAVTATGAVTTWLIFASAAHNGLHQGVQGIQYQDLEACRRAAAHITVAQRQADAWFTRLPYCTDRRPDWWWPAGGVGR